MSSSSSPTLTCDVRLRRVERCVAMVALSGCAVVPFLAQALGLMGACIFCMVSLLLILTGLHRAGWLGLRHRIGVISWLSDGRWLLTGVRGTPVEGVLRFDTRVGSRWVWLRWDTQDRLRTRSMLLTRADLPPADLRRLTVRLRLEGANRRAAHAYPVT